MIEALEARLRSAVAIGAVAADTLWAAPAAVVASAVFGGTSPIVNQIYREYARIMLLACGAELRSRGEPELDADGRYVFVSNHSSHLDALAILAALPRHGLRFVAKRELGGIPLFGAALRSTGNVFVDRTDTKHDLEALQSAQRELLRHISVLFFAEGTRSADGRIRPFKKGAAAFALQAQLPLVPVGVAGTFEILPRGLEVGPGRPIAVSFGAPISTIGRRFEERDALTAELQQAVMHEVERARKLTEPHG